MAATFILCMILLAIYLLLVKGLLFKLIIGVFGWFGLNYYLNTTNFGKQVFMNVLGYDLSWAVIIPSILILLSMQTITMKESK